MEATRSELAAALARIAALEQRQGYRSLPPGAPGTTRRAVEFQRVKRVAFFQA
jgi:hypothetical protein